MAITGGPTGVFLVGVVPGPAGLNANALVFGGFLIVVFIQRREDVTEDGSPLCQVGPQLAGVFLFL
jgi:hypothetical protein